MTTQLELKNQIENLNKEIQTLDLGSVIDWIEENIIEVRDNGILDCLRYNAPPVNE